MNQEQLQEKGKEAFLLHQNIIDRELIRRKLFLENVSDLVKMHKTKLYKIQIGDKNAQWSSYLSQVELYYSRGEVEKWRNIFSNFVEKFAIDPLTFVDIPSSRLEEISRIAESKEKAEEYFHQARVLTPQFWKDFIAEVTGKPTSDEHDHKFSMFRICKDCGLKIHQDFGTIQNEQKNETV